MTVRLVLFLGFVSLPLWPNAGGTPGPDDCSPLLTQSETLYQAGDFARAEALQRQAMKCQEDRLLSDHPNLAGTYDRMAELCRLRGDLRQAEKFLLKAITIWSEDAERHVRERADAKNGLALVYAELRRLREAESLAREAKLLWERADGANSAGVANALNTLGGLHAAVGDTAAAERLFLEALRSQTAAGRRDLLTAGLLHNLANVRFRLGSWAEAEGMYLESLRLQEQLLGADSALLVRTLTAYGRVMRKTKRHLEARQAESRARTLRNISFTAQH